MKNPKAKRETGTHTYQHFKAHFPKSGDPILLILRGHLLVEQQLTLLIEAHVREKSALDEVRLTFSQRQSLARALAGHKKEEAPWDGIRELNRIRNRLAHELTLIEAERGIDAWLQKCFGPEFSPPKSKKRRASLVQKAFAFTCGLLSGFRHGHEAALESKKPKNKASEPTSGIVTSRAAPRVAPNPPVANLSSEA